MPPQGAIAAPTASLSTAATVPAIQPYLDQARQSIRRFRLSNGLTLVVMERHQAPVVSVVTYARVGGVDEADGQTGIAHFLEHLAFKGTREIGTRDWTRESVLLTRMDTLAQERLVAERAGDRVRVTELDRQLDRLQNEASGYIRVNEFGRILETAGAVGLNAMTSADATVYYCSLPANKLELWMALESQRFLQPVLREFAEEKAVILEERRLRLENSPVSQLLEQVKGTALAGHPYARPVIGEKADIVGLTRPQVQRFFERHYGPENLTVAVVGDVEAEQVRRWAEQYFGQLRSPQRAETPAPIPEVAPRGGGVIENRAPSQPWLVEVYPMPARQDPDYQTVAVIQALLSRGRLGWLNDELVDRQRLALDVDTFYGYPGSRYPSLFVVTAAPAPGVTLPRLEGAIAAQLDRLRNQPVASEDLDRVKRQMQLDQLRSLSSNASLAQMLAQYQAQTGDWQGLFEDLRRLQAVTPADVQRVARRLFDPAGRTVGRLLPPSGDS